MSGRFEFDVFLSYSSQDKAAVRELAERLRGDGLRVWFDEWAIRPGDSIPQQIERGLEGSRTLILFMSGNAFASEWVTLERHTAMFRDPTNQDRRFVPVLLEDCEIRETLRQFAYVDWRARDAGEYGRLLRVCHAGEAEIAEKAREEVADTTAGGVQAHPLYSRALSLGHIGLIRSVAISPDGTQALSGSWDNTLRLWNLQAGTCLIAFEGHTKTVWSVAISPDGTQALSGSSDNTLRLWDLEAGTCLKTLEGHTKAVLSVAISPDGTQALSGSSDTTLRLWDLEAGTCLKTLEGHTNHIWSVVISPDGTQALSGSSDRTLRLWNLEAGTCLKTLEGHTNEVNCVAISSDGMRAISASDDNNLRLWDLQAGTCMNTLEGHTSRVWSVAISPDGRQALSGAADNTLRLWDLQTKECLNTLKEHINEVNCVAISPDGTQAISGSSDNTLCLWDLESQECLISFEGHTSRVRSVAISPDGTQALSGSADNNLCLWDLQAEVCRRTLRGHINQVNCVVLSPDDTQALSGSDDDTLRLWDLESGSCLKTLRGHTKPVLGVAISPDGTLGVSGSSDNTLRLWDLGEEVCLRTLTGHIGQVNCVMFSPDGTQAVSGSADNDLRLWDLESGSCLKTLAGHAKAILSVAISPDGTQAVSGSMDDTLRLWDLQMGTCQRIFEGHTDCVRSVAISPDGTQAVSGSDDNTLRLWDLQAGTCQKTFKGHTSTVCSVAISPNRTQEVAWSAAENGVLRIWQFLRPKDDENSAVEEEAMQYTNAKVLLVGDSGVGKSGLRIRLTEDRFEATASTDAHETAKADWATHVKLPHDPSTVEVDREIWLWDFAGQADYRLIHQLFMDETALAVLVFNPQSEDPFDGLGQWDRDLTRAAKHEFRKLLVAGRCDRGGLIVSDAPVLRFREERHFAGFLKTSALTGEGCAELKQAIVDHIDWDSITLTSSPRIFKVLKDEILRLRETGMTLLRMGELKQQLEMRLPDELFSLGQLRAVVGLLAGPGLVRKLAFGDFVLLQPERISSYAGAVVRSVRKHKDEIGIIDEDLVLAGDLDYQDVERLPVDEEHFVLQAMHQELLARKICLRERTEAGQLLVFPSYFKRERPDIANHPAVFVTYAFAGNLDEIYATLIVRLHHTKSVENRTLWRYAADFDAPCGGRMGVRMEKMGEGLGKMRVYFEPAIPDEFKVLFIRYVHDHLHERGEEVERLRHYVCPICGTPVENRRTAMKRLAKGKKDIVCVECEGRVPLWDAIEEQFSSPELAQRVREMDELGTVAAQIEEDWLVLMNHSRAIAEEAGQGFEVCDEPGIDAAITLTDSLGHATDQRIRLVFLHEGSWFRAEREGRYRIVDQDIAQRCLNGPGKITLVGRSEDQTFRWVDLRSVMQLGGTDPSFAIDAPFTAFSLETVRRKLVPEPRSTPAVAGPTEVPKATIGIVTALPKEYAAMKALMENGYEYVIPGAGAGRRYWVGEIPSKSNGTHKVTLTLAAMGSNVAAIRGTLLLEHFADLRSILMVGIAGGVPCPEKADDHVRLGDIVVSDKSGVVQYDFDKETEAFTEIRSTPIPAGASLVQAVRLLEAGELEGARPWEAYIDAAKKSLKWRKPGQAKDVLAATFEPEELVRHPRDPKRRGTRPRVFAGPIASANKLLKNSQKRDQLRDEFGVKAIEMEGAGIADATWEHESTYLVVRGVCDYCDRRKNDEWQNYAAIVAAAYARALIESMPVENGA